jgi:hypothetical protein
MNRAVGTADETQDLRVLGPEARNTVNLMAGSRAQQTCNGRAEEAVRAVRNRRDGTGSDELHRPTEGCRQRHPGVDARSHVGGEAEADESQERMAQARHGERALKEEQA